MHNLIIKLATLIHKKKNKSPSNLFLSTLTYNTSNTTDHLNIEYLVSKIKSRSYKGYLIFSTIDLTPINISILYVLSNISTPQIIIPLKKIALGFTNNIICYKNVVSRHVYNILEIIHNNTIIYMSLKKDNNNLYKKYEERVIKQNDDILDFYIGMYDIYVRMSINYLIDNITDNITHSINNSINCNNITDNINCNNITDCSNNCNRNSYNNINNRNSCNNLTYNKNKCNNYNNDTINYYLKIFKKIFLLERSDFLENLFYNFKEIKKMSKMSYSYILQETVRTTFNFKVDLEIIINDTSPYNFNLFINVPDNLFDKEYILKLSKIFKFMFKLKRVEYLCRRKKNIIFTRFINRIYFYICEEVFSKYYHTEVKGDIKNIINKDINNIMNLIYLNDNMLYKIIKELENTLVRSLVEEIKFSDEYVRDLLIEMYKKTENDIFVI